MPARETTTWLLVAMVIANMVLLVAAIADEWKPPKEFMEIRKRITALGRTKNLSEVEKRNRLTQLDALGREIEREWRQTDVETYARLTLKICGRLGALDLVGPQRHHLAQSFAIRALEKADDMPLDVECRLVRNVQRKTDVDGKPIEGEARAQLRRRQATLWLHAWQRIENTIDKNWDPNKTRYAKVCPPAATGLSPGVAPSAIKDPKLRAEYEAAIEANRQKIARATLQIRARDLKKYWIPGAERFIIRSYIEAPAGDDELKSLLDSYVSDLAKRARILDAVKNKKMPDDLILRNTTRPAK